jgi:prepilin-type N-terminal cleavage/methylation domain-containing protein
MKTIETYREQRAFTLVELLIAVAITIVMVALLGRVLVATTSVYRIADQKMDAFRDAKAALQMMANDLGRADISGNAGFLNLSQYSSDNSYAKEAYAVFPVKNAGKSDLCSVGYYLDWDGKTYSLRRFFKNSDIVAPSLALSTPDFGALYDRTSGTTPETIASYVWDLELRPGEGMSTVTLGGDPPSRWNWVEIRFKAMSVKAGQKIRQVSAVGQSTWDDPTSTAYQSYILPNEQQFATRVLLLQNQ